MSSQSSLAAFKKAWAREIGTEPPHVVISRRSGHSSIIDANNPKKCYGYVWAHGTYIFDQYRPSE